MTRAGMRSGIGVKVACDSAPIALDDPYQGALRPTVKVDYRYVSRSLAMPMRSIVLALREGAHSAREASTDMTYADGWAAAATLAQLVAFDALK